MNPTDRPAGTASDPSVEDRKTDRLLPYLQKVRWALGWSLKLVWMAFVVGYLVFIGAMLIAAGGIEGLIPPLLVVGGVCALAAVAGALGTALFAPLWFAMVFFGYTRYSLRTMVLSVWLLAGLIALIVTGNELLMVFAIPLLLVAVVVLAIRIVENDPVMDAGPRRAAPVRQREPVSEPNGVKRGAQSPFGGC